MTISFNRLGQYGRLGNQMFQYASLRGIADNNGYDFCIPPDGHRLFDIFEMKNCLTKKDNKIVMHEKTESSFNFDNELFNSCPNYTDLYGYFQSEKYFYKIVDSIEEDFTFKNNDSTVIDELKINNPNKSIVSIHVRRGDYVNLPNHHPLMDISFYQDAKKIFNNAVFAVFSDDTDWCKTQDIFKNDFIIDNTSDVEDLYLMSICDHNIIANSSFSWWAAWLNKNTHKTVVAPKKWFGIAYSHYDLSDLYPSRWIKL